MKAGRSPYMLSTKDNGFVFCNPHPGEPGSRSLSPRERDESSLPWGETGRQRRPSEGLGLSLQSRLFCIPLILLFTLLMACEKQTATPPSETPKAPANAETDAPANTVSPDPMQEQGAPPSAMQALIQAAMPKDGKNGYHWFATSRRPFRTTKKSWSSITMRTCGYASTRYAVNTKTCV